MIFEKGRTKTGGRKAGTPNKCTAKQNALITNFLSTHFDEFEKEVWPTLGPKEKKDTIIAMLNYVYPKLQSVDMTTTTKGEDSAIETLKKAVGDRNII